MFSIEKLKELAVRAETEVGLVAHEFVAFCEKEWAKLTGAGDTNSGAAPATDVAAPVAQDPNGPVFGPTDTVPTSTGVPVFGPTDTVPASTATTASDPVPVSTTTGGAVFGGGVATSADPVEPATDPAPAATPDASGPVFGG